MIAPARLFKQETGTTANKKLEGHRFINDDRATITSSKFIKSNN